MDVLGQVVPSCARVAAAARHVRIADERIDEYARVLLDETPPPLDDPARRPHGSPEQTAAYVLALDAVNFGSGWFPDLWGVPPGGGYFLLARALETAEPITAAWLAAADAAGVAALLGQAGNAVATPFVAAVAAALGELGRALVADHRGCPAALVAGAGGSAAALVARLAALAHYRDVAVYAGEPVWFLKRAQITAADLAAALPGHPLGTFADLDRLTVFADDLVPHVLRADGILAYDRELATLVDGGTELAPGSAHEVEVRAAAVIAGERLRTAVAGQRGAPVSGAELDAWLWSRGQGERYRAAGLRPHRTRTIYY